MAEPLDLTGQQYVRWLVLRRAEKKEGRTGSYYVCLCNPEFGGCGTIKEISGNSMRQGDSRSCGCLQREEAGDRRRTHGLSGDKLFDVWCMMCNRCTNPENPVWEHYGGRGIKVCERWKDPVKYFEDVAALGPRPGRGFSIDRIDNDGDYEPNNIRWSNWSVQQSNKRSRSGTSYRCVSIDKRRGGFLAQVRVNYVWVLQKHYNVAEDAARAVNAAWRTHRPNQPIPNPSVEQV